MGLNTVNKYIIQFHSAATHRGYITGSGAWYFSYSSSITFNGVLNIYLQVNKQITIFTPSLSQKCIRRLYAFGLVQGIHNI